uniref:Putative secreted protein n=1 Tax=Lutzomyia longipalpis TaxID=7200 RepID=A0A7G3AGN9_LUTLO
MGNNRVFLFLYFSLLNLCFSTMFSFLGVYFCGGINQLKLIYRPYFNYNLITQLYTRHEFIDLRDFSSLPPFSRGRLQFSRYHGIDWRQLPF